MVSGGGGGRAGGSGSADVATRVSVTSGGIQVGGRGRAYDAGPEKRALIILSAPSDETEKSIFVAYFFL